MRAVSTRRVSLLGLVGLASLSAFTPGCHEFSTERATPERNSIGEEIYGVFCDRVAAQALREDLTGESFRDVCHRPPGGSFSQKVDQSKLPAIAEGLLDTEGKPVSVEKQRADRDKAIGRIEALARRRVDLVRALDAAFPGDEKIAIRDLDNPDPTKSCDAPAQSGEGLLSHSLADMLGRMGNLYNDGTLPQSTQSLARVVEAFKNDKAAQEAWQRISARQGYRPIETALGALRPVVAYPRLRDFSNASLRLLSADSQPYEANPKLDANGQRIPVPGPGNAALNKVLEVGHEELLAAKPDEKRPPLTVSTDLTGRVVLSRPRDNLEMVQTLLYTEDEAFARSGHNYIVRRDDRGYARIWNGLIPEPLMDADGDGLPDVDAVGRFKTANGSVVPSPFSFPGSPEVTRDEFDRVTIGGKLLYDYIDTSRTFASQLLKDLKPLVNSDPEAKHETLMDAAGGLVVVLGPRSTRVKDYGGKKITFEGIRLEESPLLDLVHALSSVLGDKNADATLAMARELLTTHEKELARVTAGLNTALDIADKHPEASIPPTSTFWDETLEIAGEISKVPGLLEDILHAFATPEAQELGAILSKFARFKDGITYDPNDINGPAYNITTNSKGEMSTPVDRTAGYTGENRSALFRFLGLMSDTDGVTSCNKSGSRVHAKLGPIEVSMPFDLIPPYETYKECEVFKIDNLAAFYVDVMAEAWQFDPASKPNKRGAMYMRNSTLRDGIALGIGAATTDLIEESSGLTGFVNTGNNKLLTPTPQWLNRLVFFDTKNDSPNEGDKNYRTNLFIRDMNGDFMGSSVCPERVINDPVPDAVDAAPDGKIRGLRSCPPGQHMQERNKNTLFTLEHFGFYQAVKPIVQAFAKHGREDLFIALSKAVYRHYPGPEASQDECRLADGIYCTREGMSSYEGLVAEVFASDLLPALGSLTKALETMPIKTCTAVDATGACTPANVQTVTGIEVTAEAARGLLNPDYAREIQLTDRRGNTGTKRNDGSPVPQVTPVYLVTNALAAIDKAFDAYEEQNPNDKERRANWRRARSQLVDQFMGTTGSSTNTTFSNPTIPKMGPLLIDVLRAQLWAHCPNSFVPPYKRCDWARDELVAKASETLGGPLVTAGIDVLEVLRSDPEGRRETAMLLEYLLDSTSKNDALANLLASVSDVVQLLRDDENLLPLFKVLATAVDGSRYDEKGNLVEKSFVDAQMALLARLSGKYFDENGIQICKNEIDPNQILTRVLGKLVTPIKDGDFKGHAPFEILLDVVADVNREDPTQRYDGTLEQKDYASVSQNVIDFLLDPHSGLEQFYEVIRQGTKF